MKALVVWGSVFLALGAIGGVLWRTKPAAARHRPSPPPLSPRPYTYKDVTYSLN
jgi:hypothetical protein